MRLNILQYLHPLALALLVMLSTSLIDQAHSQSSASETTSETITVNFDKVDIYSLIETVSRHTGKNFIVDPRVKGSVSVISPEPVNADKLYELFLAALSLHGYAAVPAGGVTKIVPLANAVQGAVDVVNKREISSSELTTQIIRIKNIPVQQLVQLLQPLLPESASFTAEPASNTVIITDSAANIDRLTKLVRKLEQSIE